MPNPFETKKPSVKDCQEAYNDLVDEAEALGALNSLNADQQARWDALMTDDTGEVAIAGKALQEARDRERQVKSLAAARLARDNGGPLGQPSNTPTSSTAPMFRCRQTGDIITAVGHDQKTANISLESGEPQTSVGAVLASILTGRNDFASASQVQAAIGGNDSSGGYLLNPELSSQFVDLVRSASVSLKAGAWTIPMESSELDIARMTGDPTGYWRAEGKEVKSSDVAFDRITLRPKMLAAIVPISIELLEDAANAARVIEQALMAALGLEIDRAILFGTGSESMPRGITNNEGINTITSVGTPVNYTQVSKAVSNIYDANFPGESSELSWVMHPRDAETFDGLTDTTGQPLNPTPWAAGLKRLATTSLPTDGGSGSDESFSLLGDFSQCVIGMRNSGIKINIHDSGQVTDSQGEVHNAASQLKKLIVAHMRVDVALLRPTWFSVLEGITAA